MDARRPERTRLAVDRRPDRAAAAVRAAWAVTRDRAEWQQAAQRPATAGELDAVRNDLARLAAAADCDHDERVLRLEREVEALQATIAEVLLALQDAGVIQLTARGGIVGRRAA